MENERKIQVGISDINYLWAINDITILKINFQVMTKIPEFDPMKASEFLAKQLKEYLKSLPE